MKWFCFTSVHYACFKHWNFLERRQRHQLREFVWRSWRKNRRGRYLSIFKWYWYRCHVLHYASATICLLCDLRVQYQLNKVAGIDNEGKKVWYWTLGMLVNSLNNLSEYKFILKLLWRVQCWLAGSFCVFIFHVYWISSKGWNCALRIWDTFILYSITDLIT